MASTSCEDMDSDSDDNFLTENLKKLLQVVSHKGILHEPDLRQVCDSIFGNKESGSNELSEHISKINACLKDIDLSIKGSICELTGQRYWSFTSTVLNDSDGEEADDDDDDDEEQTQRNRRKRRSGDDGADNDTEENEEDMMLISFSKAQMEFFKLICEEIIMSPTNFVSSIDCINLVGNMEGKFSRTEAQRFLNQMIKGLWLSVNVRIHRFSKWYLMFRRIKNKIYNRKEDGQIYMGVRSISELMPYFKANYEGGLTACPLCKHAVFYGYKCENCAAKCHYYCLAKFLTFNNQLKCLSCGDNFDFDTNLLDKYANSSQHTNESTQRSQRSQRSKRIKK